MKVLGIDPGTTETGWLIWDTHARRPLDKGKDSNKKCLEIFQKAEADIAAIEMFANFGSIGSTILESCALLGEFRYVMRNRCIPIQMILRKEVFKHILKKGNGKDSLIRAALIQRFGEPGTKKAPGILYGVANDAWSALALAVTLSDSVLRGDPKGFKYANFI